jgi:LacI family transcriptional regulator
MKDVAAVAKVGVATVSRVLNGNAGVDPALARRVHDAVTLLGYRRDVTASALRRADRQAGIGLVFVDRPPRFLDADAVVSDNAAGVRCAAEHLMAGGHRRIGYLGDRRRIRTGSERLRGYRDALAARGLTPAAERMELVDSDSAYAAALELLTPTDRPTALVTGQNLITIGALRALRDLGLQHTVAMVAFDDVTLADVIQPGLSVIAQDPVCLGRRAAELLFERLDGFSGPSREVVVETRLIVRGSGEISPG